jgi:hypothetical protein
VTSRAQDTEKTGQETVSKSLNGTQDASSGVRQLLGMKGASDEDNIWKIRVQLTKPVTWIPLVWGVQVQYQTSLSGCTCALVL